MSKDYHNIPILLLIYNRDRYLDNLTRVLKKIKPQKIYIAADGPNSSENQIKCQITRKKIEELITWECDIKKKYRNQNVGCKTNINEGLDWFFSHEKMGIILEDDCDPSKSFFNFCKELLIKYEDIEKIKMISGNFYYEKLVNDENTKNSYFFSKRPGTHGWATWRRAWNQNSQNMDGWNKFSGFVWLFIFFNFNFVKSHYFYKKLNDSFTNKIKSWDYQLLYSIWKNNGLIIKPYKHLCKHIGWGNEATHSQHVDTFPDLKKKEIYSILIHPKKIVYDSFFDKIEDSTLRKLKFFSYLTYKIKNNYIIKKIIN